MDTKSVRFRKANGLQPEFGDVIPVFDVNMWRLRSFQAVEEKAVTADF
jgi:hypothetical protein